MTAYCGRIKLEVELARKYSANLALLIFVVTLWVQPADSTLSERRVQRWHRVCARQVLTQRCGHTESERDVLARLCEGGARQRRQVSTLLSAVS